MARDPFDFDAVLSEAGKVALTFPAAPSVPPVPQVSDAAPSPKDLTPEDHIQRAFEAFHAVNPHVYQALVILARRAKQRGMHRCAIGMLWEVLRWSTSVEVQRQDEYKLNDHYRSRYARLIMSQEPDLVGLFETRSLRA